MYEKLPQKLKERGAFCLWRYEQRNGDTTKVPYQISGLRGDSTNRAAFTDFTSAVSHRDSYDGIGIGVFGDICAIDIDHCVENGTLSDMAKDIIARMDSYTEYSPSGSGVRILFKAALPAYDRERYYINNRRLGLEVYVAGYTNRFVTVTGNAISGSCLECRSDALEDVLERYMKRPEKAAAKISAPGSYLSDASVLKKASSSKQAEKFNLFYTTGETTLEITAKDMVFDRVELVDTASFEATLVEGTRFMDISRIYSGETKADTSAKLLVYPVGYETPIEKAFSIQTVNTKPSLSLSPASSIINVKLDNKVTFFSVMDKTGGPMVLTEDDVKVTASFADYAVVDGGVQLALTGETGGTATIEVQLSNWTQAIKLTHKVNVKTDLPTPVLGASTLKLNGIFTELTKETTVKLNQSNYGIFDIIFTPVTAGADNIELTYNDGNITASFREDMETAPKNGNYKFNYVVILNNDARTELKEKSITVNVSSTVPTAKLKASTLTLNKNLGTLAAAQTTVSLTNGTGYSLIRMEPEGAISGDIQVEFDAATGTIFAYLLNENAAVKNHTVNLYPVLRNEATGQEVMLSKTVKVTVAVKTNKISASISAKGKLDAVDPTSAITYTINKFNNIVGEVVGVSLENDMGLFDVELDTTGSKPVVKLTRKAGAEVATNVNYKLKLVFDIAVNTGNGVGTYSVSTDISFKVSQSALKFVTIPTQKLYLFQKELVTTVTLNTPVTATLSDIELNSKTAAAFKQAMGDGVVTFELVDGGRSAEVHFEIEHPGYLVNGKSYTVILDVTPADNATNVNPTQLKLTVKAYK